MTVALVLINAAVTWYLTGLIWTIQGVHYPLFGAVGKDSFRAYEAAHTRRITWVVGPPMLAELAVSAALVWWRPEQVPAWWAWTGLALVGVIWVSTAFLQVPQHDRLARGFDAKAHAWLVQSNWLRTAAWSTRALLAAYALWLVSTG